MSTKVIQHARRTAEVGSSSYFWAAQIKHAPRVNTGLKPEQPANCWVAAHPADLIAAQHLGSLKLLFDFVQHQHFFPNALQFLQKENQHS